MIVLVHRQQPPRPVAGVAGLHGHRPVEVLDLRVGLHHQPRGADRACVPGDRGELLGALAALVPSLLVASPRLSMAALRSDVIADFTASINDGSVASTSPAISTSTLWKRWKSW